MHIGTAVPRFQVHPFLGVAVLLALVIAPIAPAQAAPRKPPAPKSVTCGQVLKVSTTLYNDVGPCSGDGLIVRGNKITVNLNGHRVFATNGPEETVGIRLGMVTGTEVVGPGTVEGFDGGVAIFGGSGNSIRGITTQNNINDLEGPCDFGDGIVALNSDNNVISGNAVIHNGPYSGIALVEDSDGNSLRDNNVQNNNVPNVKPDGSRGPCGGGMMAVNGREHDIGVRIEGPGANNNRVESNSIDGNLLAGVSLHSTVLAEGQPPNTNNLVVGNSVSRNGSPTVPGFGAPDQGYGVGGIILLAHGADGEAERAYANTISNNTVADNVGSGIYLPASTHDNRVEGNVVNNNTGGHGIVVSGPTTHTTGDPLATGAHHNTILRNQGSGNTYADGADYNANCGTNQWSGNVFATANQPCVGGS